MKIFFAGGDYFIKSFPDDLDSNILIAYPFIKKNKVPLRENYFIDSGAYSVFTGTEKVDIEEMIRDYKNWNLPTMAGLDVIGDAENTKKNCDFMRKNGLKIIPTFHFGEDFEYLEYYCQNFDYIALGGVAQLGGGNNLIKWLDKCFSIIKKYFPIKVHGFAINSQRILERYPFYSVDSTSWLQGGKFGNTIDFSNGKITKHEFNENIMKSKDYNERNLRNVKAFKELEKYITKLWEKRGIKWK